MSSQLNDVTVVGRVTQSLAATGDTHLVRLGEARALLNTLFKGTWSNATNYLEGESVNRLNSYYIANVANVNKAPESNPTEWRLAAGAGASSYTYIRYATDSSGTGFSSSPSGKTYVAFLTTATEIASPVVGDFAGLWVKFVSDASTLNTDAITEGTTNLYFTAARTRATVLTGLSATTGAIAATDTVLQGFNKTQGRLAAIEAWTTDSLAEGATNKYFSNTLARAAISVAAAPLTYASGVVGINAASANTASYVVQRDASGDFAARKLTLNTATGADHLTFGTAATLGYTGGAAAFNVPVKGTEVWVGATPSHKLKLAVGVTGLYSETAADYVWTANGQDFHVVSDFYIDGAGTGILRVVSDQVLGAATTDHLTEGATNLYFTNARADARADVRIAAVKGAASGLASLGSDSKLTTSQIPASLVGGLNYQGTWNANTNSPALASSTGTKGYYYVVSTAGTTNLDGVASWAAGDWAVFNGTTWDRVDNTDAVASVNTLTGAVVLTTDHIAEDGSPTNQWFTNARALAAVAAGFNVTTADEVVAFSSPATNTLRINTGAGAGLFDFNGSGVLTVNGGFNSSALTASRALVTDASKNLASSAVSATELGYVAGVTSAVQTQLDAKLALAGGTLTGALTLTPVAGTSGSPHALRINAGAHTTLAASTEAPDVYLALDRVVQFATGNFATQRAVRLTPPKYAFVGASTITEAATLEIGGAPVAWTNATLTNTYGLRIAGADVAGGSATAFGLHVSAPTGAGANYAAHFAGTVRLDGTFRVKADDGNYYNVTLIIDGGVPTWSISP